MTTPPSGPLRPGSAEDAALAFSKIEAELLALEPSQLTVINVDIPRAVMTALGARPALLSLRPRIVEALPLFPLAALDNLDTYALAAWYAHLLSLPAPKSESELKPLVTEATSLRSNLLIAADALAHRDLLDPSQVAQIRSGKGHIDTASDLLALATLFTNNWERVENKTAVTKAEVERAAALGPELLRTVGMREQAPAKSPSQLADQRRRAFTLLARAYDECRRAVTYLRWREGDASKFAPSLSGPRSKARPASPQRPQDAGKPDPPPSDIPEPDPHCGA